MKKFKSVAIYSSLNTKKVVQIASQINEVLENLNINVFFTSNSLFDPTKKIKVPTDGLILEKADLVIAIGGDGSLLSSARKYGSKGLPILGINMGTLGFLTDIAPEELTKSIKEIVNGSYLTDYRFFLQALINRSRKGQIALNEAVIHSGQVAQMIEFELFIDESFVYRQRADGIIISTPTGSTAYSLSGNGSIIHPDVKAITLLPMFPHSLNARPLLIDKDSNINIKILSNKGATLSLDSHNFVQLKKHDEVNISKSPSELKLVHPMSHNFYTACRDKLGWSLGLTD